MGSSLWLGHNFDIAWEAQSWESQLLPVQITGGLCFFHFLFRALSSFLWNTEFQSTDLWLFVSSRHFCVLTGWYRWSNFLGFLGLNFPPEKGRITECLGFFGVNKMPANQTTRHSPDWVSQWLPYLWLFSVLMFFQNKICNFSSIHNVDHYFQSSLFPPRGWVLGKRY